LAYLSRLSNEDSFTLISFEKSQSLQNKDAVAALKAECAQYSIDWKPRVVDVHGLVNSNISKFSLVVGQPEKEIKTLDLK
jgi:hypothetical protein